MLAESVCHKLIVIIRKSVLASKKYTEKILKNLITLTLILIETRL